tara:strand:+ start:176 stop:1438 length:1263 start_codon:yes stop_codon:yes gene_type:complete
MSFFRAFTSQDMAELFGRAQGVICYAGPGIQPQVAEALVAAAARIGPDLIIVCLDFDERVLRMGFGDLEAVKALKAAGIDVTTTPGLRMGLAVADGEGFSFTPTALFLEAEDLAELGMNGMRLSKDQVKEALARLSPGAKAAAIVLATTVEEKQRLSEIKIEISSKPINEAAVNLIEQNIAAAPLANFDLARQVRVYNARLQYVEVELNNAAIERRRIAIPPSIQELGGGEELEGRLKTTFDLIEKNSSLSSKPLADKVAKLRKSFTPSLGKKFGRAIMKSAKPHFEKRLDALRTELVIHQAKVAAELQEQLDKSRKAIVDHYAPLAKAQPPDAAVGLFGGDVEAWLDEELAQVFPLAEDLIEKMALELDYKDVTFETLKENDFLSAVWAAFPTGDWDKAHDEFKAAGEVSSASGKRGQD